MGSARRSSGRASRTRLEGGGQPAPSLPRPSKQLTAGEELEFAKHHAAIRNVPHAEVLDRTELLHQPLGRGPWLMLLGAGLLVRLLRNRLRREPLLSLLSDGLPELWAGLAAWSTPDSARALGSGLVYFLAWQFLPGLFAQAVPPGQLALWSLARERSAAAVVFL